MTSRYHPTFPSVRAPQEDQARTAPDFLHTAVIYQIFPRTFTPEGTLKAAQALLPHVASLGIDIVYLCPVSVADDDQRPEFWSGRQVASGLNNPRNPYRVKDYYNVDPEYGTADDLRAFVQTAHDLGMRVIFDLVYFHCGPGAVFLHDHPDFVERDAEGNVLVGSWRFPKLNFDNPEAREYLYDNMLYLLKEYDADGFRCDVGDCLPVDFWEEGRRRLETVKPEGIMLCEGLRGDDQHEAFDFSYGFYTQWAIRSVLEGKTPASELETASKQERIDYPRGFRWMRCFDNHDYAMDTSMSGGRFEARFGQDACDMMLATIFMLNGVPMIYNGQEVGDDQPHSIYANREHGRMTINWAHAVTEKGTTRMKLIRELTKLRHENPGLLEASLKWLPTSRPEAVYAFQRCLEGKDCCLVANSSDQAIKVTVDNARQGKVILAAKGTKGIPTDSGCGWELPQKSFVIWQPE